MPLVLLALAIFVLPGAAERLGWVPDDESLRIPLVFAALALGLGMPAGPLSRKALLLAALALVPGVLAIIGTLGRDPAETPLSLVGWPYMPFGLAAAVLVGQRHFAIGDSRFQSLHHPEGDHMGRPYGQTQSVAVAATVAGVVAAAWVIVERVMGLPAVGPFGRAGVAGPTLAALALLATGPLVRALTGGRSLRAVVASAAAPAAIAVGCVATGSRTGMLALLAGALVLAVTTRRRVAVVAVGVALAVCVGYAAFTGSDTLRVRMGVAKAAIALAEERPASGHGGYGFSREALRVRDLAEARVSSGGRPLAAHNDVLHAAAEGGVLAGLAVAAFLVIACVGSIRRARRCDVDSAGDSRETTGLACLAGAIACLVVASLAEDPLLSSSSVLILGVAVGATLAVRRSADASLPSRGRPQGSPLRLAGAVLCAAAAIVHVVVLPMDAEARLSNGSFRASEPLRAKAYGFAASAARAGQFDEARRRYARLLAWDPGATEARLDVAETERLEGRMGDAIATLENTKAFDPTRFDVPHRIGHVLLGDEPPPSRRAPPSNTVEVLRAYNDAAALAPGRFETQVAYARVHRRAGRLNDADAALEQAFRAAKARGQGTPAEFLLETFRLGEAVGATPRVAAHALAVALAAGPSAAGEMHAEADRFLDAADEADVRGDAKAAKADRDAAAIRLAGLLESRAINARGLRSDARSLAEAQVSANPRRALAIYRALLADPFAALDADLALEARAVAAPIDRDLADQFAARARTLLGYEQLSKGDAAKAEFEFNGAWKRDPTSIAALVGLARALVRQDRESEAIVNLDRAVKIDPASYDEIAKIDELRDALAKVARPATSSGH